MRSLRFAVMVITAALVLPSLAASSAAAEPRWTEPQELGRSGSAVDIAVDPAGNAVAVWAGDGKVLAAYRPAGRPWGEPALVQRDAFTANAFIDAQGDATAVWMRDGVWHVSDRMTDGSWKLDAAVASTERRGPCVTERAMGNDLAGNLVLTWTETECEGYRSWSRMAWRFADGTWGSIRDDVEALPVAALTVHDGVATLVGQTAGLGVWMQTSTTGGPLSERETLLAANGVPDIASNTRGDIVVGATDSRLESGNNTFRLVTRGKPVGESWQAIQASEWDDGSASAAVLAINDGGVTGASFYRERGYGATRVLASTGRIAGGDWTGLAPVSGDLTYHPFEPDIAIGPDGAAVAMWAAFTDKRRALTAYVARQAPGQPWGAPHILGWATGDGAQVVAYPNGRMTVIWSAVNAVVSDYLDDTVAPAAQMVGPSKDYVRTTDVPVSWRATDDLAGVWKMASRVRSAGRSGDFTAWSTWRRGTAATSRIFTAKPGRTYCFAVRATDRAGNVGAWSSERCATTPTDDRAFEARGPWSRVEHSSAYGQTLTTTDAAGARLRLADVPARALRLVARTCPTCGKIRVSHGGRDLGVVDLSSARVRNQRVILLRGYTAVRGGAVVVRVVSTGKPVSIDGLIASR